MKSGIGISTKTGFISEVDAGYFKYKNQLSIGWQFIPQVSKTFVSIKYGYWHKDFVFHGGVGLVNRIENRIHDTYVHAYGATVIGAEYHFRQFAHYTRPYTGIDVVDKTVNLKFGIKVFYD